MARPAIKQHGVKVAIRSITLSDWGKLGDEECVSYYYTWSNVGAREEGERWVGGKVGRKEGKAW